MPEQRRSTPVKKRARSVLTPGGSRPAEQVHQVGPTEAVGRRPSGTHDVVGQVGGSSIGTGPILPPGHVLTPGGPRSRSVVHLIEPKQKVDGTGKRLRLVAATGELVRDFGVVGGDPEPRFQQRRGNRKVSKEVAQALGYGWVVYAEWDNEPGSPIISFRTRWTVPRAPATESGQTIFLFNGIENDMMILQPVLQWGVSAAGGGNYWSVASWYVDGPGGQAFLSPLVRVQEGDVLVGAVALVSQSATGFDYVCQFEGIPNTRLSIQNVEELLWCFETLEVYRMTRCSDYPADEMTRFDRISIQLRAPNPSGGVTILTPPLNWLAWNIYTDCGQRVEVISKNNPGGEVDIHWPPRPFNIQRFRPWAGYAIPNGLWMVGDFTGDGRSDILHAVQNSNFANVWLSKGDGTFTVRRFTPAPDYRIPAGLWMVGDFNGDGKADILHAVQNTNYANVWLSNGNGTFTIKRFSPSPDYAIPNGLWLVGDLSGDGKTDVVHVVQNTDYVNVWLSNGDGTFTVRRFSPWAGYAVPNGLWLVGDFDGNGKSDILHAVQNTDYVNVWLSNGDGRFQIRKFSPEAGYGIPNGLWLVGDFDGDGKSDIFHAVQNTDYANVWLSNGNGTFTVHRFSPWPGYAMPNGLWMVGDFDGDGKTDLLHAVENSNNVNLWLSNGDGTFRVQQFYPWSGYLVPNGLWLVGDYNDDGKADVVHAVQNSDFVNVWLSQV